MCVITTGTFTLRTRYDVNYNRPNFLLQIVGGGKRESTKLGIDRYTYIKIRLPILRISDK